VIAEELQFSGLVCGNELVEEQPGEQAREHADGEEEARTASEPRGAVERDAAARHIPTVLDRLVQQAVMQVLQRRWDPTFSQHSYGFRPGRSAHKAIAQAQEYIRQGYEWVVDLDLEKVFDRVNHDKLMGQVAKLIEDKRLLKLIRAFLNAGVIENGLVSPSVEGPPQGDLFRHCSVLAPPSGRGRPGEMKPNEVRNVRIGGPP
jgi:hypothetical protein